jgi:hypothetical protein
MREIGLNSNFVSQNPTVQTFGLGSATQADQLIVEWPDGRTTVFADVQAGQRMSVDHPDL